MKKIYVCFVMLAFALLISCTDYVGDGGLIQTDPGISESEEQLLPSATDETLEDENTDSGREESENANDDVLDAWEDDERPRLEIAGFEVTAGMTVFKTSDGGYARSNDSAADAGWEKLPVDRAGFFVIEVLLDGNAHGKLQPEDHIVAIDGAEVFSYDQIAAVMNAKNVGDSVVIDFVRDGEVCSVEIVFAAR